MKKIILLLFLLFVSHSFSQQQGRKLLSLDDCYNIAAKNNPDIKLNKWKVAAAGADLTNAFGNYLPSLNFSMNYRRTLSNVENNVSTAKDFGTDTISRLLSFIFAELMKNQYSGVSLNNYFMQLNATWIIFDGFARDANYSRSNENLNAIYKSNEFVEKNVYINITRNYIDVVKNQQIIKARRDNLELSKRMLERINAQYQAGLIAIGDVYSQEAELGNNELALVQAENDLNISKAILLTTLGLNSDSPIEIDESSIPVNIKDDNITKFREEQGSINANINNAFNLRQDYKSNEFALKATESGVTSAYSQYYPKISAFGSWNWSNDKLADFHEKGNTYLGLSLNVPIFENFSSNNQVQYAQLQLQQKLLEKQNLEQNIRNSVQTAFLNLEAAEKQIEIAKRTLKSTEKNYESVKEKYQIGASTITELHIAENQLLTTKINNIKAIYNYLLAQKELLFATGKF